MSANDCDGDCYTTSPNNMKNLRQRIDRYQEIDCGVLVEDLFRCYSCSRDHAYATNHGDDCQCLQDLIVRSKPIIVDVLARDYGVIVVAERVFTNPLLAMTYAASQRKG